MPKTTINRGNVLYVIVAQVALTPVSVLANTTAEQTFTIQGLQTTDQVSGFSVNAAPTNQDVSVVNYRVSAANTLSVAYQNGTGGNLTPQAGNYLIEINRPEDNVFATNFL